MDPEFSAAQDQTADKLWQQGDFARAIAVYRHALRSHPDSPDLLNNLARLLATCPEASLRNCPEAVTLAEKACQLTFYSNASFMGTLVPPTVKQDDLTMPSGWRRRPAPKRQSPAMRIC